jgi:hypothetical protein
MNDVQVIVISNRGIILLIGSIFFGIAIAGIAMMISEQFRNKNSDK